MDIIALCDHNSIENAGAAMQEGERIGLTVLPGMEICSREEVHILAIFDELANAESMQALVYDHLPGTNQPEIFGHQVVADAEDVVVCENEHMLIGATELGLHDLVRQTHEREGLSVTCHIDRQAYSIFGQLGFIPDDLEIDAVEISALADRKSASSTYAGLDRFEIITSSDAHFLKDIGRASTVFKLAEPTLAEIRLALRTEDGRRIIN
jgi:PHP family Zn ribbon phosphoesterase